MCIYRPSKLTCPFDLLIMIFISINSNGIKLYHVKGMTFLLYSGCYKSCEASLGGSVGCAVQLETRRSWVQPPPRSATFFRGD